MNFMAELLYNMSHFAKWASHSLYILCIESSLFFFWNTETPVSPVGNIPIRGTLKLLELIYFSVKLNSNPTHSEFGCINNSKRKFVFFCRLRHLVSFQFTRNVSYHFDECESTYTRHLFRRLFSILALPLPPHSPTFIHHFTEISSIPYEKNITATPPPLPPPRLAQLKIRRKKLSARSNSQIIYLYKLERRGAHMATKWIVIES